MPDIFTPGTVMDGSGDLRPVAYGSDRSFHVTFYMREVEDEAQTKLHNRRIVKPVPYCRKEVAGDSRTIWDAPVSKEDKMRWPQQWRAFEDGESEMVFGTPLDAWPLLTADHRAALKNMQFKTVEQIRDVTDSAISSMAGGNGPLVQNLRDHADAWLKEQEKGALETKLTEALAEKDNQLDALKAQMETMTLQMQQMQENKMLGPIEQQPEPVPEEAKGAEALADIPMVDEVEPPKRKPGRPRREATA